MNTSRTTLMLCTWQVLPRPRRSPFWSKSWSMLNIILRIWNRICRLLDWPSIGSLRIGPIIKFWPKWGKISTGSKGGAWKCRRAWRKPMPNCLLKCKWGYNKKQSIKKKYGSLNRKLILSGKLTRIKNSNSPL